MAYPINSPVETDRLRYRGKALVNGEEFELFETTGSFLDVGSENSVLLFLKKDYNW